MVAAATVKTRGQMGLYLSTQFTLCKLGPVHEAQLSCVVSGRDTCILNFCRSLSLAP